MFFFNLVHKIVYTEWKYTKKYKINQLFVLVKTYSNIQRIIKTRIT